MHAAAVRGDTHAYNLLEQLDHAYGPPLALHAPRSAAAAQRLLPGVVALGVEGADVVMALQGGLVLVAPAAPWQSLAVHAWTSGAAGPAAPLLAWK